MSKKSSNKNKVPPSAQFIIEGMDIIKKHPLFGCMNYYDRIRDFDDKEKSGSAYVTSAGYMVFNKNKRHSGCTYGSGYYTDVSRQSER